MSAIQAIYADAPYEVKIKAPLFQRILIVLLAVYGFFDAIFIFYQLWNFALLGFTIAEASFVYALIQLRSGKYDNASVVVGPAALLALYVSNLTLDFGPQTFGASAVAYQALFLVPTLFVRRKGYVSWLAGLLGAAFVLQIVLQWGAMEKAGLSFLSIGLGSVIFLSVTMTLGVMLQSVFNRISVDQAAELEKAEKAGQATKALVAQVAVQLDKSSRLKADAETTAASGYEIERNVQSIQDRIGHLNQRFRNSETALEAIAANLAQLSGLAEEQTGIVGHSGSAVEEMVASIQNVSSIIDSRVTEVGSLKETAQGGRKAIAETGDSFKVVVQQIESIREMTKMITGIAAQTNLLAMNAAIEAAHAGEAGSGFSVVAAEIRKLAESSSKGAATIGQSLKALTGAIGQTDNRVKATGAAFEQVESSIGKVVTAMEEIGASTHEMNAGTAEILKSTSSLQTSAQGVDGAARQVAEAYRQILDDVKQVSRIISEVAAGMEEIGAGATEVQRSITAITELAADLEAQTARLHQAGV